MKFFFDNYTLAIITISALICLALFLYYAIKKLRMHIDQTAEIIQAKRYNKDKTKVIQEQKARTHSVENNLATPGDLEQIVDVVVQGPWTKYVIMRKLGYLRSIKYLFDNRDAIEEEKGNKLGYWQLITMAHDQSPGKHKGKGR